MMDKNRILSEFINLKCQVGELELKRELIIERLKVLNGLLMKIELDEAKTEEPTEAKE